MPALSNNSHELFHSNLWSWLIRNDKNFIRVFFDDFDVNKKFEVYPREKYHMDLVIKDEDGNYYVIENKFKSIPNKRQLQQYANRIEKEGGKNKYLLTFLIDLDFKTDKWEPLYYDKISKRIREIVKKGSKSTVIKKYRYLLEEYCDYIDGIVKTINDNDYLKKTIYFEKTPPEIKNNELKVIYQKIKVQNCKVFIDKKIKPLNEKFNKKGYKLYSTAGYNNGKTTLTYRVQKNTWNDDELSKHTAIEIQVEGRQYRYMARLKNESGKVNYKDAFSIFKGTKFYNEKYDKKLNNIIHNNRSSMKWKVCKYLGRKNRTIAIYQYYDLKDIRFKDLSERIVSDLNDIYKMLKKLKIKKFLDK